MWAISPVPFWQSRPPTITVTTATTTTSRPACICRPITVSAKYRRQSRPQNESYDCDEDEEDGSASVNSNASQQNSGSLGRAIATTTPNSVNLKQMNADDKQLSGSDVLWAMRKVSAKKTKLEKREIPAAISTVSKIKGGNEEDCSDIEPLCIKADWSSRLDDLERRLRELKDT